MPDLGTRRRGQKGTPRAAGTPRPLPGAAAPDYRADPAFLTWQARYNPAGTVPEWLVFTWLERHGRKYPIDFQYQVPFGGGREVFGAVVTDFVIQDFIALAVNGQYWHFIQDPTQRGRDELARARVESLGYVYVEVLDLDILTRIEPTMQLALLGQEQPGAREGHES
jgi:hypothetical protein